jgi:dihydroxy-acid dehydratase
MGAISMDLPSIFCPAGPMSNGQWRGQTVGAGTHTKKYWQELRAGRIGEDDWIDLEGYMTRSVGTCNTMGTASTMTSIVDAMGLTLPGASSIPAADSRHSRMASACGVRIVDMVWEDLRPSKILDRRSFLNGAVVYSALGGSTNAAVHLIALARRAGVKLTLDELGEVASRVPVCVDLFPTGEHLMEDFYFAGGLLALLRKLKEHLQLDARTLAGVPLGRFLDDAHCWNDEVIRSPAAPVVPPEQGRTLVVLKGNLAPDGAVIKTSAADPKFLQHTGRAIVFDGPKDLAERIEALDIAENDILVLRNAGPIGAPGMPEWGNLPIPKKLLDRGVRDMVRICDGRMSGTHYGTCVLHVCPEAAVGGPLALIRDGDRISLDVPAGRLDVLLDESELTRRRTAWTPPERAYNRSYAALYQAHVSQADKGCDFDFLEADGPVPEPIIY